MKKTHVEFVLYVVTERGHPQFLFVSAFQLKFFNIVVNMRFLFVCLFYCSYTSVFFNFVDKNVNCMLDTRLSNSNFKHALKRFLVFVCCLATKFEPNKYEKRVLLLSPKKADTLHGTINFNPRRISTSSISVLV